MQAVKKEAQGRQVQSAEMGISAGLWPWKCPLQPGINEYWERNSSLFWPVIHRNPRKAQVGGKMNFQIRTWLSAV